MAVPLPLLLIGLVAWLRSPAGVTSPLVAVGAGAVIVAGLSAAIAGRRCTERRMHDDVVRHERELAHTKRQILALVSHELRTPVTGVVGFSRTLSGRLDALDRDTVRLFVDAIDEHSSRLARLIDNVVVASRTPLVVVGGSCQLSSALSEAVAAVGVDPDGSRVRIAMEGPLEASIDEDAAIRVLANLIDNAIRFGDPEAPIHLDGHARGDHVVIRVANAGPAIPLGLRSALYDPFVQGDSTDTRTVDGLGLGLHVCRQLVEAHGGTIDLVDHPRLTVFEVSLPAARTVRARGTHHRGGARRTDTALAPTADRPRRPVPVPQPSAGLRQQRVG